MDINTNYSTTPSTMSNTPSTMSSASKSTGNSNTMVDKDGYLKLFLASLQHQDPLAPMETKDMMEQMSQLTLIEQITNMGRTVETLQKTLEKSPFESSINLIGKTVTGKDSDGKELSGVVDEVRNLSGKIELIVGGKAIEYGSLTKVANQAYSSSQM